MKRIVSLLLVASMILSMFATVFAATYPDLVGDNAKYAAAVDALTELKVVNGFPDGEFKPGNELTRAELAKMIVICEGLGDQVDALAARTVFSDVPATHWASGYINAAAQSKIIVGYPDGTFQPEKNVTYAEAFTMALRALGYGNVVEAEGTWPTAYMLKAVELELTDDMENVTASAAALRGNTAILLWNMLRTPMWRITEESEANGMTLSDRNGRIMLNIKFPDYRYLEDVYLTDIDVKDKDEVRLSIGPVFFDANGNGIDADALVKDIDLTKLVIGMKVTVLEKDYKDEDKATFLTVTPANTIVTGLVKELSTDRTKTTFKVDGVEYRFAENNFDAELWAEYLENNDYVAFEAEGKKIVYNKTFAEHVITLRPVHQGDMDIVAKYATTASVIEDDIGEDDLVIIGGKWASRDDVVVGSVYTQMPEGYWVATTEPTTKTFDQIYTVKEDWNAAKVNSEFVSLDDEEFVYFANNFKAYKGSANKDQITPLNPLAEKPKDNDYTDNDVEVFTDAFGIPVRLHFGDVDTSSKNAGFYAIVSNGFWGSKDGSGKTLHIGLANEDGSWMDTNEALDTTTNFEGDYDEAILGDGVKAYYREGQLPLFSWVKLNDDGKIERFSQLYNGLTANNDKNDPNYDDRAAYRGKYDIVELVGDELKVSSNKVTIGGTEYKISNTVRIFESRPIKDEKDRVEGYDVSFPEREEYNDTTMPEGTLVAIDPSTGYIKYIFAPGEADSAIKVGKVTSDVKRGKVGIDGVEYEVSDDSPIAEAYIEKDQLVLYRVNRDETKVKVEGIFDIDQLDFSVEVVKTPTGVEDDDKEDAIYVAVDENTSRVGYDLEDGSDDRKTYKTYNVFEVILATKKSRDNNGDVHNIIKISSAREVGKGLDALKEAVEEYARIFKAANGDNKYMIVFKSFDENQFTAEGEMYTAQQNGYAYNVTSSSGV